MLNVTHGTFVTAIAADIFSYFGNPFGALRCNREANLRLPEPADAGRTIRMIDSSRDPSYSMYPVLAGYWKLP